MTAAKVLTVDAVAPTATMTAPRWWFGTTAKTPLAWVGADDASGVASYDVRVLTSAQTGWTSRWHYPAGLRGLTGATASFGGMHPGWQYCFEARAHDRAGNVSRWSAARCVARGLDDGFADQFGLRRTVLIQNI